jgi:hypothetical protein
MFRALPCSSSGGLRRICIYAASGIVTLNSKRNIIPYLLLVTASIMERHNLALVFKRGFGNRISFSLLHVR